jgi:hypothetical protein
MLVAGVERGAIAAPLMPFVLRFVLISIESAAIDLNRFPFTATFFIGWHGKNFRAYFQNTL